MLSARLIHCLMGCRRLTLHLSYRSLGHQRSGNWSMSTRTILHVAAEAQNSRWQLLIRKQKFRGWLRNVEVVFPRIRMATRNSTDLDRARILFGSKKWAGQVNPARNIRRRLALQDQGHRPARPQITLLNFRHSYVQMEAGPRADYRHVRESTSPSCVGANPFHKRLVFAQCW